MILCAARMEEAFAALKGRSADAVVVTTENSPDGPVHRNLDLFLRHPNIRIYAELVLLVNRCLLGLRHGSSLRYVVNHLQALSHCSSKLTDLDFEVEDLMCAADTVCLLAERRLTGTTDIGSRVAAREFGPQLLESTAQLQPLPPERARTDYLGSTILIGLSIGFDLINYFN